MEDNKSAITHTVVPPSMRSNYWRHFGFPCNIDNKILTREKIICKLCNKSIAYNKNTSNLRTHLVARHPERMMELHRLDATEQPALPQAANNGADGCTAQKKRCYDDNARSKMVTETVPMTRVLEYIEESLFDEMEECDVDTIDTESEIDEEDNLPHIPTLLVANLNPICTVKDSGIRNCFKNKHFVDEALTNLGKLYEPMRNTMDTFLHWQTQRAPFALGIECTRNHEQLDIVSVYVHFVDTRHVCDVDGKSEIALGGIEELRGKPLQLLSLLHRSGVCDELTLTDVCRGLELAQCAAIVSNTQQADVVRFAMQHGIPLIECFESVLTRCLERIFQLPTIEIGFAQILRSSAEMIYNSELQLHPTCVWSKFDWLQYVVDNTIPSNADVSHYEAWNQMQRLITYIKPLKLTLDTLAAETLSLSTVVRPLTLRLLEEHFAIPDEDARSDIEQLDEYIVEVRGIINEELRNSILANSWLSEATLLDVRFQHEYIESNILARNALELTICMRFKDVIEGTQNDDTAANTIHPQMAKRDTYNEAGEPQRKSSLKKFLTPRHATAKDHSPIMRSKLDMELARYRFEQPLDLDQCPLRWWRENAHYRQLHAVAEYYLCVPPCVNRLFRLDTETRFGWRQKRHQLREFCKMEKCFWYMHYNRAFYAKLRYSQTGVEDIDLLQLAV